MVDELPKEKVSWRLFRVVAAQCDGVGWCLWQIHGTISRLGIGCISRSHIVLHVQCVYGVVLVVVVKQECRVAHEARDLET